MWDEVISQVHVQDVPGVDANLQPTKTKRVTFMVGKNGPFTLTYTPGEYTAERVEQDIRKEVTTLRALHDATQQRA